MDGYWRQVLSNRISRRRALTATGAAGLSVAFLAACGGDDGGGSADEFKDASGLLTKPVHSSNQGKQGGTWQHYVTTEVLTMDPLNNASTGSGINNQAWAYSRFLQWKPGIMENPVGGEFVLDAAESWEQSPDGLRLTFKLRGDMKFDPRPPTNGRLLTTEDVKFSWDRFSAGALTRADYINRLNPEAPIESITIPDSKTVQFKLAFPTANMASRFAFHRCLSFLPVEAEGKFDARTDQRGSGPWMLRKWEPSVGYTYDRNPNWPIRKGQPFLDTVSLRLITEAAQRRAQLVAGNLMTILPANLTAEDTIAVKKEQPKLNMYANQYPWGAQNHLSFGWAPGHQWSDVRVRRAVSMLLERDLWIDTFYNVSNFEKQGLPMDARWNSHYFADDKRYWLDPKPANSKLGEGAKYFQYNVAEATALMKAAGFNNALRTPAIIAGSGSSAAINQATALRNMLADSGLFDLPIVNMPIPEHDIKVYNSKGAFEGLALQMNHGVRGDIDQYLSTRFSPAGASGTQSMFPEVYPWYKKAQDLVTAQRREFDEKKRLSILEELQKELAVQMPTVPYPGAANNFSVAWPQLQNWGVFSSQADPESTIYTHVWLDESKKPA